MKTYILTLAVLLAAFIAIPAQMQKLDQLFDQYEQAEGVTSIKIAKPMFGMLSKLDIDDSELNQLKPILNKFNGLKILILEKPSFPKDSAFKYKVPLANYESLKNTIFSAVKNLNYEELMTVNSKDAKVRFLSAGANKGILDNLLLNITSEDNAMLVMLDGKISMDDINKLMEESPKKPENKVITQNISSTSETQFREVGAFDGIEVKTGINATFSQNNQQSVQVTTEPEKAQYVVTKVKDGILEIYIDNKGERNLRIRNVNVEITAPHLKKVMTNSGANFGTKGTVREKNLTVEATSGSDLRGSFDIENKTEVEVNSGSMLALNLNTESLTFNGTSGSDAKLTGSASNAVFAVTSGNSCKAIDFLSKNAEVSATSGASVDIQVSETLNAKASSGGSIRYKGNPQVSSNISKNSGGSLKQIN